MKNVLVVAYLYPPIFNSGTRRTLEFVNLPDTGWIPTVLTVANPDPRECDDTLLAEVRPGTRIERAPLMINEIARKIAGWLSPLVDAQRMEKAIEWRLHKLWRLPDATASWAPAAVEKAIALHAAAPFDAIYATGWPWTSFLIAEKISRRTGVPFVVDYRDLWKASDAEWDKTTSLQHLLQPRLERRVLKRASAVIATTKSFLKLLPQASLPSKQYAITNGFGEGDFPSASVSGSAPDGRIRIVYTGVWRPGYGPDDLYLALQHLKSKQSESLGRLMVVTAGFPPGRAREYGLEDLVTELGRVPHSQAIELMLGATALYLPVSGGLYEYASIPGKLFEYLGSGRPILASAQSGSEVAGVLDQVGGTLRLDPGDSVGLASAIEKLCDGSEAALFSTRSPVQLATFTRGNLTKQLSLVLDDIACKPGQNPTNP
jgi:glycosyltransferase involved in cell wall biosynthesis